MYSKPQLLEAVEQEAEVNGLKAFENIVDKDGHKRFIEGDAINEEVSGITFKYSKWALSGSHLLLVLAIDVANTTVISANQILTSFPIPQWIYNKVYEVWGQYLERKNTPLTASNWGTQNLDIALRKNGNTKVLDIFVATALTLTADRGGRIAFDLLIDNE